MLIELTHKEAAMRKERNQFFGEMPEKTPKKNGTNLPVILRRKQGGLPCDMEVRFDNATATSFGGYVLWDSFLKDLELKSQLAQHIKMDRGKIGFTAAEISRFFIDSRVLGAERLMDVDAMRFDPVLTQAYGIDGLPSDETIGRYFKSFGEEHLASVDRLNVSLNDLCWQGAQEHMKGRAARGQIILDYDSSTMTVYGEQEGADRGRSFRKKDQPGFQPKFAFIGGLGVMVNQHLYAQSVNLPKGFEEFHEETLTKLPQGVKVWALRGDGALYSQERIQWCEGQRYTYAISAARTQDLHSQIESIPPEQWLEDVDQDGHAVSLARIAYRPVTWQKPRTYVISRRLKDLRGQQVLWDGEKYKYFAYVTNYRGGLVDQFKFCVERCSLEGFIKEGKAGFHYDACLAAN